LDELPPFSPILNRLLARLTKEDVLFAEISDLIEKDTALAGNVLRVVNSALYGLAGTVNSVRHALSILGLEKARNIVLAMSVVRLWRHEPAVPSWSRARFNLHSAATAVLADLLVQHLPAEYPEGAFTAGLFHDLGKFLIASALPLEFEALRMVVGEARGNFERRERELVGITHADLAAAALTHWNLPPLIARAVRFHHSPEQSEAGRLSLSRVVQGADETVNRLEITMLPSKPGDGSPPQEVLEELGLTGRAARVIEEFDTELELIKTFF
jgi:HD-like signal output (HDOD) protein